MGRFVGDRIFPKEHRRTGVYTTTCFCNDERNTTCVCVVCVVCVCCVCACVHFMYMYLHIYSGFIWSAGIISVDSFFFHFFFLVFMYGTYLTLCTCMYSVCDLSIL